MKRRKPSPHAVADVCLASAWRDEIDDESRLLLEQAHDTITEQSDVIERQRHTIRQLMNRSVRTAKILEVVEAELAAMRFPLLGNEDPGMGL